MKRFYRIGLECEFLALKKSGEAVTRPEILQLWQHCLAHGWKEKRDYSTKELVGVTKKTSAGMIVMDNDGGPCLLEVAFPPFETISKARTHIKNHLAFLYDYFGSRYRILGYGTAPFTDPLTVEPTPKGHYFTYIAHLKKNSLRPFYVCGALQINMGASIPDLLRAENIFLALSGPLTALSANTSIYNGKKRKWRDIRGKHLDTLGVSFIDRSYQDIFGLPPRSYRSWQDYFCFLLNRPGLLLLIEGRMFEVMDRRSLLPLFLKQQPVQLRELYSAHRTMRVLSVQDLHLIQTMNWLDSRLKFSFDPNVTTKEFLQSFRGTAATFEKFLTKAFNNTYIEVRPVAMQQPSGFFSLPAFAFGLLHNLTATEKIVARYSWNFWRKMRVASYTNGIKAKVDTVLVADILAELLPIARTGLKKRAGKDGQFLEPLQGRIVEKRSPADDAEFIFKTGGEKAFLDALTIYPNSL